jgi:nitroreductase
VDVDEAARTAATVRYYRPDPVDPAVVEAILDTARFAPSGGNRQAWHVVVVTDPHRRRQLQELYLDPWDAYVAELRAGGATGGSVLEAADHFAQHLADVPVHLLVCVAIDQLVLTDLDLPRPSIVGGASIYPFVQNVLLGCRAAGLGATMTTMLCRNETRAGQVFEIPDTHAIACLVSLGHPEPDRLPRMRRQPVAAFTSHDTFGVPWAAAREG